MELNEYVSTNEWIVICGNDKLKKKCIHELELIRMFSDQLLKRKRLGVDILMRGMNEKNRSSANSKYVLTLYELLKAYSNHQMRKNFLSINIPKLPVCSTELGIEIIKSNIKNLNDWKDIAELVPKKFTKTTKLKKTGLAGIFSASLELTREGLINISQKKNFSKLLIKERK